MNDAVTPTFRFNRPPGPTGGPRVLTHRARQVQARPAQPLPEQRRQLLETHERSEAFLDDQQAYDAINTELHELIYRGACNAYLESSIQDARARLRVYRRYPFQKPGRIQQSFRDHEAIVTAILGGHGEAASLAMHDHLTTGGRIFADLVAQMRVANEGA